MLTICAEYTLAHAFFLLMGGVHIYDTNGFAIGPLTGHDALYLIRRGSLTLPPLQKIDGLSKSSTTGKLTALAGLLWFVIPCLSRIAQRLEMAAFEVMALAHTTIAIITFIPWWCKPMNVECPERVSLHNFYGRRRDSLSAPRSNRFRDQPTFLQISYAYIFGSQDVLYDFNTVIYVPMFWAGDPDSVFTVPVNVAHVQRAPRSAYVTGAACGLLVAIIFGLLHCIAWHYEMPSSYERALWRVGAVLVSGSAGAVIFAFIMCIFPIRAGRTTWPRSIMTYVSIPCVVMYAVGRLMLIAVACSSVRRLAPGVFLQGSLKFVPL